MGSGRVPLWIKVAYGLFLCVLVPVYGWHYGLAHFLWASDIALFLVFVALVREKPLLSSMMAIGVAPFEVVWTLEFLSGSRLFGMADYMFEAERPLYLRGLSLFHIMLPVAVVYALRRLGYDRRALLGQTLLAWVVLPVTYLVTDPADNVNMVFGFGTQAQTGIHPLLHLGLEMVLLPIVVYAPFHLLARRVFDAPPGRGG